MRFFPFMTDTLREKLALCNKGKKNKEKTDPGPMAAICTNVKSLALQTIAEVNAIYNDCIKKHYIVLAQLQGSKHTPGVREMTETQHSWSYLGFFDFLQYYVMLFMANVKNLQIQKKRQFWDWERKPRRLRKTWNKRRCKKKEMRGVTKEFNRQ